MNANDSIRDAYIIRGILLEQLKSSHATKIKREYKKILDDILTRLNGHNEVGLTNMNKIIKEIKQAVAPEITLLSDLQGTAESEAVYVQSAINASAGVEIAKRLPKDSTLLRIVNADLFEGNTVMETFTMFDAKLRHDLQGEIRQSVVQGETISQIKQRITNRFGLVGKQAETIARTATHSLVNKVRDEVYAENEDIFKGYKSIAVLDSRTTLVCASMDNLQWDLDYKPIGHSRPWIPIPRHPNCRSIKLPITKSYRELGFDMDEVDGLTRSSLDGAVPQKMNFNDWLKTKDQEFIKDKLGLGKAKLFMEGKITIGDLVTKNGRELTLAELNGLSKSAKVVVPKAKVPKIEFGYGGKFDGYVADIRDEAKIVIDKLPKPKNIIETTKGSSEYFFDTRTVQSSNNKNTFTHEYGHHIDSIIGSNKLGGGNRTLSYNGDYDIMSSIEEDKKLLGLNTTRLKKPVEALKSKFYEDYERISPFGRKSIQSRLKSKDYEGFSDIIDASIDGKAYDKYGMSGHGGRYYKYAGMKETEIFANMFQIWSTKDKWAEMKLLFPNTSSKFEIIMKDITDGKFD